MSPEWLRWYRWWCGAVGLFGVVIALGAFDATSGPALALYDALNGAADLTAPPDRFSVGLVGAVTIGWSLTMWAAIRATFLLDAPGSRSVWRLLVVSLAVWYVIDNVISVATGYALNAVSNTVIVAAFLYPLVKTGALKRGA